MSVPEFVQVALEPTLITGSCLDDGPGVLLI
jgi:hypothetical protein